MSVWDKGPVVNQMTLNRVYVGDVGVTFSYDGFTYRPITALPTLMGPVTAGVVMDSDCISPTPLMGGVYQTQHSVDSSFPTYVTPGGFFLFIDHQYPLRFSYTHCVASNASDDGVAMRLFSPMRQNSVYLNWGMVGSDMYDDGDSEIYTSHYAYIPQFSQGDASQFTLYKSSVWTNYNTKIKYYVAANHCNILSGFFFIKAAADDGGSSVCDYNQQGVLICNYTSRTPIGYFGREYFQNIYGAYYNRVIGCIGPYTFIKDLPYYDGEDSINLRVIRRGLVIELQYSLMGDLTTYVTLNPGGTQCRSATNSTFFSHISAKLSYLNRFSHRCVVNPVKSTTFSYVPQCPISDIVDDPPYDI